MDFESVNVLEEEGAAGEMKRLGIPLVPATVLGGKVVHGWNPAALAELVGVSYDAGPALSPPELAQSLDNILYYAQHLAKRLDGRQLELKHPERERTLRNLIFHIFRLSTAFVDCMEQGGFPREWLEEDAPPSIADGEGLAAFGARGRERIGAWFSTAPAGAFTGTASTYYGDQSVHLLLERTAWHAGQHLRQVRDLLERDGSLPVSGMGAALFEGLPMPDALW